MLSLVHIIGDDWSAKYTSTIFTFAGSCTCRQKTSSRILPTSSSHVYFLPHPLKCWGYFSPSELQSAELIGLKVLSSNWPEELAFRCAFKMLANFLIPSPKA